MTQTLSPGKRLAVFVSAVVFLIAALVLTSFIPPVEGLGEKVRLPMFHGGSTWVSLVTFTIAGLFGLAYLVKPRPDLYRWAAGFRFISAPLWVINTVLGVVAAMQTWDFTGSSQTPFVVIREDPRLMTQFILLLALGAVLALDSLTESRALKAFGDVVFAALMWILLVVRVFNNAAARALHPDNPVLNSAANIQIPFFSIVVCLFLATVMVAWLVRDRIARFE